MDSIVIFDRIRENGRLMSNVPYDQMVNTSLLQTMTRSVNTLATVLITLFALYFFGGDTLKNFAFALLVGVTSGAYSSIFIASPLLVMWKKFDEGKRRREVASRVSVSAPQPLRATAGAAGPSAPISTPRMPKRAAPQVKRSPPPPRYRRKKIVQSAAISPNGDVGPRKRDEETDFGNDGTEETHERG